MTSNMIRLLCLLIALPSLAAAADAPPAACATADEVARVAAMYSKGPAPMPFQAQEELKLPESTIASALPGALATGIDGSHFRAVWDSLVRWETAMVMIRKGGNVFEVTTKIVAGEPSKRSKYFNLGHESSFSGHLRPDLITSIYAVALPGREGLARGLFFYDAAGESVFAVFLPGEGATPSAKAIADFENTWGLVKSLPARCGP
jgi:putative heme iron utilization protein